MTECQDAVECDVHLHVRTIKRETSECENQQKTVGPKYLCKLSDWILTTYL